MCTGSHKEFVGLLCKAVDNHSNAEKGEITMAGGVEKGEG